jgi:putative hydrolase of the HAD superfamily
MTGPRLHLIFDADDTLWEANILFERAINDFVEWIAHPTSDKASITAGVAPASFGSTSN